MSKAITNEQRHQWEDFCLQILEELEVSKSDDSSAYFTLENLWDFLEQNEWDFEPSSNNQHCLYSLFSGSPYYEVEIDGHDSFYVSNIVGSYRYGT